MEEILTPGESFEGAPFRGESFGTHLRRLRREAGISQEELAARSGLSANAVGALERGQRKRPYPHTVNVLAEALSLDAGARASLLGAVPMREAPKTVDRPYPEAGYGKQAALPTPATPLVGRDRELEELQELIRQPGGRLITLTGVGGVGKTRLALEVAHEAASLFSEDAVFVRLAPLSDAELLTSTVLHSLGAIIHEAQSLGEALIRHLHDKELLLVLDNFEHLLEAVPEVADWLESCPRLKVLATSRAPLRLRAETEYQVPPLSLPASSRGSSGADVLDSDSGALFAERARASAPGFALTEDNAPEVAAICWRLAGLPLALELAAAKVRFLEPAALLSHLDRALSAGWARDLPERQRTMRATLDWSYELLDEIGQRLFRRLGTFAGGFSLEAAEYVGVDEDLTDVLHTLGGLVEQSLVTVERHSGTETRYRMLEPIRQYALHLMEECGEEEAAQRHAGFFLVLAERAHAELRGPRQIGWIERLDRENSNLRVAMGWALTAQMGTVARFGWALWVFWWIRGYQDEGRRWMEALLDSEPEPEMEQRPEQAPPQALTPGLRGRAANVAGSMSYIQGDFAACEEYSRQSLRMALLADDGLLEGYSYIGFGVAALAHEDFGEAASSLERAIPLLDVRGEQATASISRIWLGTALFARGEVARAAVRFEEGLVLARRTGDRISTYMALYNLAQLALDRGDHDGATTLFEEGVILCEEVQDQANLAYFLDGLAVISMARGEAERVAHLTGASKALSEQAGAPVYNFYRFDRSLLQSAASQARDALGATAFDEARAWGRCMTTTQAATYALGGSHRLLDPDI